MNLLHLRVWCLWEPFFTTYFTFSIRQWYRSCHETSSMVWIESIGTSDMYSRRAICIASHFIKYELYNLLLTFLVNTNNLIELFHLQKVKSPKIFPYDIVQMCTFPDIFLTVFLLDIRILNLGAI